MITGATTALPALTSLISTVGPAVASATSAVSTASPFLLAGGGALSAYGQVRSAEAQRDSLRVQGEREKLRAADERIARNESLLRSMAQRNASTGSRGITAGSATAAMQEEVRQSDFGQLSADATSAGLQGTLRRRGDNARTAGRIAAGASLLRTLGDIGGTGSV